MFFGLFGNKKKKMQKDHIKNLIALSRVDGIVSEQEREHIFKIGIKYGFKEYEVDELLHEAPNFEIRVPKNNEERFDQIFDLVQMMLSDGVIEGNEMDFCIDMAERLGFRKAIVGVLVRKISEGVSSGQSKDAIRKEAHAFLV